MNKRIIQLIPSIILYIFAGLLAAYALWAYNHCADIISQARAAGQLATSGNEYDIASFYMGNCGQYAVFALLLAAVGLLLQRKRISQNVPNAIVADTNNVANDTELDEWFNEIETANKAETEDE